MGAGAHVKHALCAVSSSIFGFWYIFTLFILALLKNDWHSKGTRADPTPLTRKEKRLTFNLNYYLEMYGFGLEHHDVLTSDGHFLAINRIIHPDTSTETKQRYPLLLIPGLMQSSSAYCTAGPDAIGLVLSRQGYDVWLGNNRGGFHPRHVSYGKHSAKTWDWEMKDMAQFDVPAMVEYIKKKTGASKIAIGAHSQGTTQTFMALAREEHGGVPHLGQSVSSFSALAPAVYAGPLVDRWFLKLLRVNRVGYHIMMGYHCFIGLMGEMRRYVPLKIFTFVAYLVFNYMLHWNDALWDRRYRSRNFIFTPVFISARLMFWWLGKGGFAARKCIFVDESTQWFDEEFPALELYACGRDDLVPPDRLINRIHNYEPAIKETFRVNNLPTYSHLDVLWAMDASTQVALPMSKFIWSNVQNKEAWHTPQL